MKKWLGLIFLFSAVIRLDAQDQDAPKSFGVIKGKIADSATGSPVDYATISLFQPGSDKPLTGTTSNHKGVFVLEGLAPGTYRLVVDFIGYKSREKNNLIISDRQRAINLGTLSLSLSAQTLAGVTVTAP